MERKLMTKAERLEWVDVNWRYTTLKFTFRSGYSGTSAKLLDKHGECVHKCSGGGYDMHGTLLGKYIMSNFYNKVRKLDSREYYGLTYWNTKLKKRQNKYSKYTTVSLDGACGRSSMERILNKIGFGLRYVCEDKNSVTYVLYVK